MGKHNEETGAPGAKASHWPLVLRVFVLTGLFLALTSLLWSRLASDAAQRQATAMLNDPTASARAAARMKAKSLAEAQEEERAPLARAEAEQARLELIARVGFRNAHRAVLSQIGKANPLAYLYRDLDFIHEPLSSYCPNRRDPFLARLEEKYSAVCSRLVYRDSEHQSFTALVKSPVTMGAPRLLIYNHGHLGLPVMREEFAYRLVTGALDMGFDVLLVSMPLVGLDRVGHDFRFKSWDGAALASGRMLRQHGDHTHALFELMDTGRSHYVRFFVDSATVGALSVRGNYQAMHYMGLSGGAWTGLYVCVLMKDLLDSCTLAAGVMPLNLRTERKDFGDAEQISSSFHRHHTTYELIRQLSRSTTRLHLIYNADDACCFDRVPAERFRQQLVERRVEGVAFTIRQSRQHDYDPHVVLDSLSSAAPRRQLLPGS